MQYNRADSLPFQTVYTPTQRREINLKQQKMTMTMEQLEDFIRDKEKEVSQPSSFTHHQVLTWAIPPFRILESKKYVQGFLP